MRRTASVVLVFFLMAVLPPTEASAQNLLVNPDFDTDVTTGWSGIGIWDPMDAFGSPTSGSVTWINTWATGGALYHSQCVELGPDFEAYDLTGWTLIPSGQAGVGYTHIHVYFYSDPGCVTNIGGWATPDFSAFDFWQLLIRTDWAPNGAVSAKVSVANQKNGSGDFQVLHDAIYLGRNQVMIFADGFQSGDLSEWGAFDGGAE